MIKLKNKLILIIVLTATGLLVASLSVSKDINSQLTSAASAGKIAQVESILNRGAHPDAHDTNGKTALGLAAFNGNLETVKLLLDNGANVNVRGQYGKTPLMAASAKGHHAVVRLLLDRGADVNAKDWYGQTPLICCFAQGISGNRKDASSRRSGCQRQDKERLYRVESCDRTGPSPCGGPDPGKRP